MFRSILGSGAERCYRKGSELLQQGKAKVALPEIDMDVVPGNIYCMSVTLLDDYRLEAEITDKTSGRIASYFATTSFIDPAALSMYKNRRRGNTTIYFDDLVVDASDYLVPAGRFVRSPHFVVPPRQPYVEQDQDNWVGAQSTMVENGEFLMWYRIRDNQERGRD